MSAQKLAIVDKLLPLLEAFGASRRRQSDLRRAMKAARCTERVPGLAQPDEAGHAPCYDPARGRTPWCEACRQHDQAFAALMAERKANKRRLLRIERLAVAYAEPEPEAPPEPKELLELIHKLEKEEDSGAEADLI